MVLTEPRVLVAIARSAAESMAVDLAHSGWALADYSAVLPAYGSVPVVPRADDSIPPYSAPAGLVVLSAQGGPSEPHCSRDK